MKTNVFQLVKSNITTKDAVIHYGMYPNKAGLICCPFHNDKHPSMKVDKRYYCFACGASGDAIDFVKEYFGLSVKDAACKLAEDFGLTTDEIGVPSIHPSNSKAVAARATEERNDNIEEYPITGITKAFRTVADYAHILKEWKVQYAPKHMDEEWDEHFEEVLVNLTRSEYLMDGLLFGSREECKEFYKLSVKEVERIGKRVTEIEACRNSRNTHIKR